MQSQGVGAKMSGTNTETRSTVVGSLLTLGSYNGPLQKAPPPKPHPEEKRGKTPVENAGYIFPTSEVRHLFSSWCRPSAVTAGAGSRHCDAEIPALQG